MASHMATHMARLIVSGQLSDPDGGIGSPVIAAAGAARAGDLEGYLGSLAQLLSAHGGTGELSGRALVAAAGEFNAIVDEYLLLTNEASLPAPPE
jgi:hypothetical protein